jgi:branched-chain amino acid transport system substrate-binding protein
VPRRPPTTVARLSCCALAVAALLAAGCGGDDDARRSGVVGGLTLTIYSSLPLQGTAGRSGRDLVRAESLAVTDARGRAGRFRVRFISLDNALPDTGAWDAAKTSVNARTAVRDPTTIAYVGDAPAEATAISLPILNEAGILQVSPTTTYVGFTRAEGADAGEPDRYYPFGQRTFARVIPADHGQAAALVRLMRDDDCGDVHIVDNAQPDLHAIAPAVERAAASAELDVVAADRLGDGSESLRTFADRVARLDADCLYVGATDTPRAAAALVQAVHRARPSTHVFASADLAVPAFLDGIGAAGEDVVRVTSPLLPDSAQPRAAQRFLRAFAARYGHPPAPEAIYGYEAVKAILVAVDDAGDVGNDRAEVVARFLGIADRRSVLGTYDIDDDGDTTLSAYGVYSVRGGRLIFDRVVRASAG